MFDKIGDSPKFKKPFIITAEQEKKPANSTNLADALHEKMASSLEGPGNSVTDKIHASVQNEKGTIV